VRNFRIGAGCLHVNARFATLPADGNPYDFDPRTSAKNSAKTPPNEKGGCGAKPVRRVFCGRKYVVCADSGRAEIVWRL
jgi:hypothetical protein